MQQSNWSWKDGDKANITRTDIIMTGTKRRHSGGGGSGGKPGGNIRRIKVTTTMNMIDLVL
jgi:hypothetical protein